MQASGTWATIIRTAVSVKVVTLLSNLVAGVVIAHALGPTGRGSVTAVQVGPLLCSWIFSLGAADAIARELAATAREEHPRIAAAWITILAPLSLIGAGALELGLPILLGGQDAGVVALGRLVAITAIGAILTEFVWGAALGTERYRAYNLLRGLPSIFIAIGYVGLYWSGHLTVDSAVLVAVVGNQVPIGWGVYLVARRRLLERPHLAEVLSCMKDGVRLSGAAFSAIVNARLDLLIAPAFVAAAALGQYSVASNVTFLIVSLASAVAPMLLPIATRDRSSALRVTRLVLTGTLAVAAGLAALLAAVAGPAVDIVYGSSFHPAVVLIAWLLPGTVLYAGAQVMIPAIIAEGKFVAASACQAVGALVTVVGLVLLLPRLGVEGAAVTSSAAYGLVFVASVFVHKGAIGARFRDYLITAGELRLMVGQARIVAGIADRRGGP